MILGQPLTLECIVTTVRGINSQVDILWSNSSKEIRRNNVSVSIKSLNFSIYRDHFNISQLTADDNDVTYKCEVVINAITRVTASDTITLYAIGKYVQL